MTDKDLHNTMQSPYISMLKDNEDNYRCEAHTFRKLYLRELREKEELEKENKQLKKIIDIVVKSEEEIMYLANKTAITTQNMEVRALRDRLEDVFEILKGANNE